MKTSETVAHLEEKVRPLLTRLPPALATRLYSRGRRIFLASFYRELPLQIDLGDFPPRTLWGLEFGFPLLNAAGLFKQGEGYGLVARQASGGYLAGTTTGRPRSGNRRRGIVWPFAPYPRTGAASNWLGLPNPGHRAVAERLREIERVAGCPLGVSVAASPEPELGEDERLAGLLAGMRLYEEAGVDFLEVNESCPNTEETQRTDEGLQRRLETLSRDFLERRQRSLPVLVKFSCDTRPEQVPDLVDLLLDLGFDGVNFGNTSTDYGRFRDQLAPQERTLYDFFTSSFGGGVSGRPLKSLSLQLATRAVDHLRAREDAREFHVVRTGGVETGADLAASEASGIALNQWFTGYFAAFSEHGHALYRRLAEELVHSHPRADPTSEAGDS